MKKIYCLIVALFQLPVFAQEIKLKINQSFEIESSFKSVGVSEELNICNFHFKVSETDIDNNWILKCSLERINNQTSGLGSINSEAVSKTTLNSTFPLLYLSILKKEFSIKLSPKGKIIAIDGLNDIIKQAAAKWALPPLRETEMLEKSKFFPTSLLSGLFLEFPLKSITFGSEWKSGDGALAYKVVAIKGALLDVTYSRINKELKIDAKGNLTVNTVTGIVEKNESVTKRTFDNPALDKKDLTETWTRRFINNPQKFSTDTAWINMAVLMSYWSTYFKTNATVDASKVKNFFKYYDPKFSSDPYYVNQKLDLLQQADLGSKDKSYYKLLTVVPNHFIAGTHHLHNKMSEVVSLNADSAYQVAIYLSKTSSFYGWIQNSFSQYFLRNEADRASLDKRRKSMQKSGMVESEIDSLLTLFAGTEGNKYKLKNLLEKDKNALLQRSTKPLFLWVDALSTSDTKTLIKISKELKKVDDSCFIQGNAARYQLLVHQMLLKRGEKEEAFKLLDHSITKLSYFANDTLNNLIYAHRNLLAGAYYQKYQLLKETDTTQAHLNLFKAFEYSPNDIKEKAYIGFYDRFFLNTKESYRKDYIELLLKSGKEKDAVAAISQHLKASPEDLEATKKLYEASFKGKDFRQYFSTEFIANWQPTPAFKLKGIDSTSFELKHFENKWVVVDFWGTWCSPCRKEMPAINKFSELLNDGGKYNNVNFLSIACRDSEANVKSYFSANNFIIPAAMSDGVIEQNFKVDGYPSKYIIAPNGKMLNIKFGKDWEKILDSFVKNYAVN